MCLIQMVIFSRFKQPTSAQIAFGAPIRFARNADGSVAGFILEVGGEALEGTRVDDADELPTATALAEYAGAYYSDEVGSVYTIDVVEDTLHVSHLRRGQSAAAFVGPDEFVSNLLPAMTFERDAKGRVVGLNVSARHLAELRFEKIR